MTAARSLPLLPEDIADVRAWDWAGRELGVDDAEALVTRVQDLVAQVAQARRDEPDHPAWPPAGAVSDLGLTGQDPRAALATLDRRESDPAWQRSATRRQLDQARQELLCALALDEDWPREPAADALLAGRIAEVRRPDGTTDASAESPTAQGAPAAAPLHEAPPAADVPMTAEPGSPSPGPSPSASNASRTARTQTPPPRPSLRRVVARRVGRKALQITRRLVGGPTHP